MDIDDLKLALALTYWAEYQPLMETKRDRLFPKRSLCAGNGTIIEPFLRTLKRYICLDYR